MSHLKVNSRCKYNNITGTIKFYGKTQFSPGIWVGIELDEPVGRNSGSVSFVKYFECKPSHGVFVRSSVVDPINNTQNKQENNIEQLPSSYLSLSNPKLRSRMKLHSRIVNRLNEDRKIKIEKIEGLKNILRSKGKKGEQLLELHLKRKAEREKLSQFKILLQTKSRLEIESKVILNEISKLNEGLESQTFRTKNQSTFPRKVAITKIFTKAKRKDPIPLEKKNSIQFELEELKSVIEIMNKNYQKRSKRQKNKLEELIHSRNQIEQQIQKKIFIPKEQIEELKEKLSKTQKENEKLKIIYSQQKEKKKKVKRNPNFRGTKENWIPQLLKKYPKLVQMREQLQPISGVISYSKLYKNRTIESPTLTRNEELLQFIMHYYSKNEKKKNCQNY